MSALTESLELMSVTEIKQEEFDDFLQEYLIEAEPATSGLDHAPETETCMPTFSCKQEPVKTKEEEESEEYEHGDCSASRSK